MLFLAASLRSEVVIFFGLAFSSDSDMEDADSELELRTVFLVVDLDFKEVRPLPPWALVFLEDAAVGFLRRSAAFLEAVTSGAEAVKLFVSLDFLEFDFIELGGNRSSSLSLALVSENIRV